MKLMEKLRRILNAPEEFWKESQKIRLALGRVELRQIAERNSSELRENELCVFSQWGEDGILQFLLRHLPITNKTFVEFGVETYREANTRFLLVNDNWRGLIIDGSAENIRRVRADDISWRHSLVAVQSFVTRENINSLLAGNGFTGELGILSIDIDGNDYWVWEAINVVNPAIVVVEYNYRFGPSAAVTVPYQADFTRQKAHHSCVYYGASIAAFERLATKKGYSLVGSNSAGNNAFFVRNELLREPLRRVSAAEAYVQGKFREARGPDGQLSFLGAEEEKSLLADLPLVEVR